ncbi:c-type cytochrome [Jannaschia aquimarina]|uniref:Cytochrome c2 n=1 Tax=Jannaschia aquimarina TaxID=935700 RepID=A0A0D1ED81_9RHOB|nr:cytochrome c [Jannaschia aquimarina]KIT14876.1 Cytochrome c2 [Jannaschia aquimarina]SNS58140.1 cytochrome c [Jannaschia aquimarina]
MIRTTAIAAALLAAGPAFADAHTEIDLTATGDAAAGESAFRQCQSCHVVADPDGEVLAGRAARTGPNLYGVVGRVAGVVEDFRYSDIIVTAGEGGLVWDEANMVAYLLDPTGHLQEVTGENGRGKMSYRVRAEDDALNLYAFLAQFTAPEGTGEETN